MEKHQRTSGIYEYYHLTSRVHPIFKMFGDMFYLFNQSTLKYAKKVPSYDSVFEYLTPKAIGSWMMVI